MTNASVKNSFVVLSLTLTVVTVLSLGAFASTVHADDYGYSGYAGDSSGGYGSADTGCCDYGYTGYAPDTTATTDYGYTGYAPDTTATTDYGYTGYAPDTTATTDYGYTGYAPDTYSATPTYSSTDYGTSGYTDYTYGASSGSNYGGSSYMPSYTPSYTPPAPIYPPTYYSTPAASRPVTVAAPQQQQQQQQQQSAAQPINIVNNNNNTNTNTNTNPVTVTNVTQATPQPIVQYTYPTQPIYQQPTYQNLYCSITASPNNVQNGQYSYLTWSSNGTSATLSNVGSVAANGSFTVHPYGSTTYTLTIYGQGGSATCSTYVTVANVAPVVSLSQIPYTGFDFGPVGNAIYWMSLLAFAAAGAYLLMYFKGGALALAMGMVRGSKTAEYEQPRPLLFAPQQPVETAVEEIVSETPAVAALSKLPTMQDHSTKDSMVMARTNGVPRIVITRA